jgi:hypothetical protein
MTLPDHIRQKIREQYPDDPDILRAAGFLPAPKIKPARFDGWALFVAEHHATETRHDLLQIHLPGLRLRSENAALSGDGTNHRIKVRAAASAEAKAALMANPPAVWRFEAPVAIAIVQHGGGRIDTGNLYHKPLIDCLTTRGGGLGVLDDDGPRQVRSVTTAYADGPDGVTVMVALTLAEICAALES